MLVFAQHWPLLLTGWLLHWLIGCLVAWLVGWVWVAFGLVWFGFVSWLSFVFSPGQLADVSKQGHNLSATPVVGRQESSVFSDLGGHRARLREAPNFEP